MSEVSTRLRPPLFWVGGKRYMVRELLQLMPPHRTYVEVFGGAGWLLFAKPPSPIEVYNDVHSGLVNLYRVIRDPEKCRRFQHLVEWTPYSREEYELCRDTWMEMEDDVEKARRFFVAIRQAFGGQEEGTWGFTVTADHSAIVGTWNYAISILSAAHQRLKEVQIEHDDFRNVIPRYDSPETLFYCDPPYLPETTRFTGHKHSMSREDHEQLLHLLNGVQGMVLLSGYDSRLYRELLDERGWRRYEFKKPCQVVGRTRSSNLQGDGAIISANQYRVEVVWLNAQAQQRQAVQSTLDL